MSRDDTVRLEHRYGIAVAALSHPGLVRERNEDAFLVDEGAPEQAQSGAWQLIAVADGVGGHSAGDIASELALDAVEASLADLPLRIESLGDGWRDVLEARLRESLAAAQEAVQDHARRHPEREGMATTLVMAVLSRGWLGIVHVGDSRAYVLRGGCAHPLTADHTWAAEELERGALDPSEVERSPLRRSITRAVGLSRGEEADVAWLRLVPGDVVVLATDGLTRYVEEESILATIEALPNLEDAARNLVERALEAGGRDNITVVIARFDGLVAAPLPDEGAPVETTGP
jgi:serine/threonine protein phosphatase PrpC